MDWNNFTEAMGIDHNQAKIQAKRPKTTQQPHRRYSITGIHLHVYKGWSSATALWNKW